MQLFHAATKSLPEGLLLVLKHIQCVLAIGENIIGERTVLLRDRFQSLLHKVVRDAEIESLQNGATNQLAKGITLSLIRRDEPLSREQVSAAEMIGNDTHFVGVIIIRFAGESLELLNNRLHQRDFENVKRVDAGSSDTLKAGTKIDVFLF